MGSLIRRGSSLQLEGAERVGWQHISRHLMPLMHWSSSPTPGHLTRLARGSTRRLWQHRFSRTGPHQEGWQGLFVPLTAETGLADVHCTWGGVLIAEAVAALRPAWHLLLSDVAPTALFEVRELVQLCEQICHNNFQPGRPGLIGTEPHHFPIVVDDKGEDSLRRGGCARANAVALKAGIPWYRNIAGVAGGHRCKGTERSLKATAGPCT